MGMCNPTRWAFAAPAAGLLILTCCIAAEPDARVRPGADTVQGLVVHEWGTFSTFSGSNGTNLSFSPYDNDLPDFVHGYLPKNSKAGPQGGLISLETPVLYFYADRPQSASVQVDFPKGIFTEWYPYAARSDKKLAWDHISVMPNEPLKLPNETKKSRYYAARETDAAPLRVGFFEANEKRVEQEKFLFYRGVGDFDMPLSARAWGGGSFTVHWDGRGPEGDLVLVQIEAGKLRFRPFRLNRQRRGAAKADIEIPETDSTIDQLGETMVKLLIEKGMLEKEARAMVKTWSSAWFGEEGTRILYILPPEVTDAMLPLHVDPKPKSLVRVLVGRHDLLTPERERRIDSLESKLNDDSAPQPERDAARNELAKLGRYTGAVREAAETRLKQRR